MPCFENVSNSPLILDGRLIPSGGEVCLDLKFLKSFEQSPVGKHHLAHSLRCLDDGADVDTKTDADFVFDPEVHHIEHRGGGKYYVMDQETKVSDAISKEEADAYTAMINGE